MTPKDSWDLFTLYVLLSHLLRTVFRVKYGFFVLMNSVRVTGLGVEPKEADRRLENTSARVMIRSELRENLSYRSSVKHDYDGD